MARIAYRNRVVCLIKVADDDVELPCGKLGRIEAASLIR